MSLPIFLNGITLEQLAAALKPLLIQQKNVQENIDDQDDLLTPEQACKFLSIGKTTLNKHSNSGRFIRLGLEGKVFYSKIQILGTLKPINE
jgi:hypothetical protein